MYRDIEVARPSVLGRAAIDLQHPGVRICVALRLYQQPLAFACWPSLECFLFMAASFVGFAKRILRFTFILLLGVLPRLVVHEVWWWVNGGSLSGLSGVRVCFTPLDGRSMCGLCRGP